MGPDFVKFINPLQAFCSFSIIQNDGRTPFWILKV